METKSKRVTQDDDRITQLPDSILGTILSCLTMREAVRTCILSTRWRYLWTTSLSNLNFDSDNMLNGNKFCDNNYTYFHNNMSQRLLISCKRMLFFFNSVDQFFLHLNSDHKIKKMKVYFFLRRNKYGAHLDQWISRAIQSGLEELNLYLFEENCFCASEDDDDFYDFPSDNLLLYDGSARGRRYSSLKCLRLAYCNLAPKSSNFLGFNTLTTLDLMLVDLVSDTCLQNLLSNCCLLKWLSLYECYNIDHLKIEHPSCCHLKYLNVYGCNKLKAIEINGIDLETWEYKGYLINFRFRRLPNLKTVFTHVVHLRLGDGVVWPLSRLPVDLPHLETLFLSCSCYLEAGVMPERLPKFPNLKHLLILEVAIYQHDLLWIATVLEASPAIQKLELHLRTYDYDEEPREIYRPPISSYD